MRLVKSRFLLLVLLVAGLSTFLSGCATNEDSELSARPWNAPKNWENGLPSAMTEGR